MQTEAKLPPGAPIDVTLIVKDLHLQDLPCYTKSPAASLDEDGLMMEPEADPGEDDEEEEEEDDPCRLPQELARGAFAEYQETPSS